MNDKVTTTTSDTTETQRATRLLVTGFERFGSYTYNPTETLVNNPSVRALCDSVVLPVEFERAKAALDTAIATYRPDAVLMLGLAESAKGFRIESQASSETNSNLKDNAGLCAMPDVARATLQTTIPASLLTRALSCAAIPFQRSSNAGRFVCNTTLLHALRTYPELQIGFAHLPFEAAFDFPVGWQAAGLEALIRGIIGLPKT